ncbi:uncharacterized protein LOC142169517 [Nicotiana tabacum]|uniref:Uncharacterized protein LOC142169517 n=1 Tax=Nicotiana tabacum TaxID=4097 RepID=A0AC58SR83_TOBAC
MEQYTPGLKVTKVIWEFPSKVWIKVNIDGASRGNSGRSSIGYVLRDEEGDVIFALGREIPHTTNNEAEAIAILKAMRYCVDHRVTHVMLQTDSMLLKNVLEGKWVAPCNVNGYVEEIKMLMEECNVRVSHTLREGNSLADRLANCALDSGDIEAHGFA